MLPRMTSYTASTMSNLQPQQPSEAWKKLSKLLPSRDIDSDFWWNLTGKHLALLLDAAGYAIERQYEALLFHYHWAVSGPPSWPSTHALIHPQGPCHGPVPLTLWHPSV